VTETTATPSAAAVDQTLATATAATANAVPVPANDQVHPRDVVSQIAHQADLYRLPGNKGVRINLHPEDLGGVQVTLRYAAGGSLELHINVEHATTGALVQAGWTELRDALATQGIGPERLVMSITGPSGANQLDFSSNGGGSNRPDSGLAAFTQGGDSGQQRQNNGADDTRAPRGWSTTADASPVSDDAPRSASVAAASRIDYRV
jgi:flagellar hook-length control protein FliK